MEHKVYFVGGFQHGKVKYLSELLETLEIPIAPMKIKNGITKGRQSPRSEKYKLCHIIIMGGKKSGYYPYRRLRPRVYVCDYLDAKEAHSKFIETDYHFLDTGAVTFDHERCLYFYGYRLQSIESFKEQYANYLRPRKPLEVLSNVRVKVIKFYMKQQMLLIKRISDGEPREIIDRSNTRLVGQLRSVQIDPPKL